MPSDSAGSGCSVSHRQRRPHPGVDRGPERRHLGQHAQGLVERGRPAPRRRRRRGWRPPSRPARRRWRPRGRAPSRWPSRAASAYAAVPRSTAWRAHHADEVPAGRPVGERIVDGVVVQRDGQRVVPLVGVLGPGVGPAVERARVGSVVVQLVGGVEPAAVDVDRGARRSSGSTSAPAAATCASSPGPNVQPRNVAPRQAAARRRASSTALSGRVRAPASRTGRGRRRRAAVEVLERLDVDDPAAAASHTPNLRGQARPMSSACAMTARRLAPRAW